MVIKFIYTGHCYVEESDIVKFLLLGQNLGVAGVLDELDINDPNNTLKDAFSEEQNNGQADTINKERNGIFKNIVKEKGMTVNRVYKEVMYDCNQCDYTATLKGNLTTHIKSFHGEMKYLCNQCNSIFTLQGNLTTNIQSVHEGVKYGCNHCDYRAA